MSKIVQEQNSKKIQLISLGCPKNLVDSEIMAGTLMGDGYKIVDGDQGPDTIIINTCGFIEDSKTESIQRILDAAKLKEEGKIKKLVVAGCLTQRYKSELVNELPEADIFIGSGEFQNISKILKSNEIDSSNREFFNLPTYLQQEMTPRVNSQPGHRAYIKISEGCLKRCTFCAIPSIRGNLQSRKIESIVKEAKDLVANGVKELIIISHDFTDYGWDLRRKDPLSKETPVQLLRALCEVEGLKWIRMLYLYPDGITPEMIQLIKENDKMVKYFDMPLQHIADPILQRMNRKMTRNEIETVLENIREQIPEAVIRTQFIVGFPGETNENFDELLQFIKTQKFDRVGCFKYSPEDGTPSAKMDNQVEEEVKESRYHLLMKTQQKISKKKHSAFVGKTLDVLVEGFSEETDLLLQGRTSTQAPEIDGVVLINEGSAEVGDMVKVRITDNMEYDLIGSIIS